MSPTRRAASPPKRSRPARPAGVDGATREAPLDAASLEARYKAIIEQSHDLLMIVGADRRLRWGNAAFQTALGYSAQSLEGVEIPTLVHEDDLPTLFQTIEQLAPKPGQASAVDFRLRAADGSWHYMETSATNLLDEPAVRGFVVSLRDTTARVLAESALKTSDERYQDLIDRAHEVIYSATLDGRLLSVNAAAAIVTGYNPSELLAKRLVDLVAPGERAHATEVLAGVTAGRQQEAEMQIERKDGQQRFIEVSGHFVARNGGHSHIEGIARDVTERHEFQARLQYEAIHDPLTGLPNRTLFLDRLNQALMRRTDRPAEVAVLLLDVDGFKLVNDELGHAAGDEVLVELAHRFNSLLRRGETIARLGGDEFALVAETDGTGLIALAERLLTAFATPLAAATKTRNLTASLGIAVADPSSNTTQLLRDADTAMYRVKAVNRGCFAFFDASMREQLLHENAIRNALETALHKNELDVYYQPIVSLADNDILAVEALVRWPHPQWGWVPPDDFIPLAEQTGLIIDVGRYVLDRATRDAARWRRQNPDALPQGLFVNVSPRELAHPNYTTLVAQTLSKHGLKNTDLALELTERVFINENDNTTISTLNALSAMGIRLILDDFGTGYSALSSLKRFPFAALKIDRSFIQAITTPDTHAPITKAVLGLGASLGLAVIAEGIETDTQLNYLRNLHCDAAQGFKLARPQSTQDITKLLKPPRHNTASPTGRKHRSPATPRLPT